MQCLSCWKGICVDKQVVVCKSCVCVCAVAREILGDKGSKSDLKRRQLEEAKELLRQHGVALPTEEPSQEHDLGKKHKHKKSKKKHKHKSKD